MKGQISASFAWIFGILAGIAVFSVIIAFGTSSSSQAESQAATAVFEYLETEIEASSAAQNTFNVIETGGVTLQVRCDVDPSTSSIYVEGTDSTKATRYQPIFSPQTLEGRDIYAWSTEWKMPGRVYNFLYLSNRDHLLVFVNDSEESSGYIEKLGEELPDGFETEVIQQPELSSYTDRGYSDYVFIHFRNSAPTTPSISGAETMSINVAPTSGLEQGKVYFHYESGGIPVEDEMFYDGIPMLFGAFFSANTRHYDCNQQKAENRLQYISRINLNRTISVMEGLAQGQPVCEEAVQNISKGDPYVVKFECNECLKLMKELPEKYRRLVSEADYETAQEIRSIGKDLAKGRSCPTL